MSKSHYVVLMNYFNNILLRNCLSTHHYKFKEVCISFIFKVNIWGKAKVIFNPRPVLDDACLISWYGDIKTCIVLWNRNTYVWYGCKPIYTNSSGYYSRFFTLHLSWYHVSLVIKVTLYLSQQGLVWKY